MSSKAASSSPVFLSPRRMGNQARRGEAVREGWHTQRPMNSSAPWTFKTHTNTTFTDRETAFPLFVVKLRFIFTDFNRSHMCPSRKAPPRRWAEWPSWPRGRRKSPPRRRWASGPRWGWECYAPSQFSGTGGGTTQWRRGLERHKSKYAFKKSTLLDRRNCDEFLIWFKRMEEEVKG